MFKLLRTALNVRVFGKRLTVEL